MKPLRILQSIGYLALFLASVFNFVNQVCERMIFGVYVTTPLFVLGTVGIGCGIALLFRGRKGRSHSDGDGSK